MKRSLVIATACLITSGVAAFARTPPQTPPQTPPPTSTAQPPRAPTTTGRPSVPMPVQKQAIDYFVGSWSFDWMGPDTPLGPGTRAGTVTFTLRDGAQALDGVTEAKSDEGAYRETIRATFDPDKKALSWSEKRSAGVTLAGTADWNSPLAIRFDLQPVTIKGQTYRIKRTISVISAGSFSMTEEYAVGGGPFKRLGNAIFTKQSSTPPRQ